MSMSLGFTFFDALQHGEPKLPSNIGADRRGVRRRERAPFYLLAAIVLFYILWWAAMMHAPSSPSAEFFWTPSP